MDDTQSLVALASILNEISEKPQDVTLHLRHIEFAKALNDHEAQISAFQMFSEFLAVGDDVWLPLIEVKERTADLNRDGVEELLELCTRAEADYMSIPILQKHLQFLVDKHAQYQEGSQKHSDVQELFSTTWTREAIQKVVNKGLAHLTRSCILWDVQRDWELSILEKASNSDQASLIKHVEELYLDRLQQPHSNSDETFQSYSSFTTKYKPPAEYEALMVAASKRRSRSVKGYNRRETLETSLTRTGYSLEGYAYYVGYERRAKYPDLFVTRGIFERAIAEAARQRHRGEQGAEEALQSFWIGYCDAQRILNSGFDVELETFRRALRSVPGSGEVWARYMRFLERVTSAEDAPPNLESVSDAYVRALNTKLIQSNIEQIVPVTLARAGHDKRRIEAEEIGEDGLITLLGVLEAGIEMIRQGSKTGDGKYLLEKFLAAVYEDAGLADNAVEVWRVASKDYKSSYSVWINYTDALVKRDQYEQAREVFVKALTKQLDWPEAVWEAWISFEHSHGSVEDIDNALDRIEQAQYLTNVRRAKEVEKVAYQAAVVQSMEPVAESAVSVVADAQLTNQSENAPMDVDPLPVQESSKKRGAEDGPAESQKKARFETNPPTLKRDRENTTVFVADLPDGVQEEEIRALFKDCGNIREVKIIHLSDLLVALVEFYERDSIPAALTKDKKRLLGKEIAVHLAWKSTVYVTNFPESADDGYIRRLFEPHGTLFDVRWPSKKFKNSRRFCYVQYTSPAAAEQALELHGRKHDSNLPLNVYISNPERKKDRTDQDANEREVYVAGLNRFTSKADIEKLFLTYGKVKDVRIATDQDGHAKGYAFVEFEEANDAQRALDANNCELQKRRIAVTLSDSRVRAKHRSDTGLSRLAEARIRSVRVRNLPPGTQEGLLQQAFEKIASIRRVEVFVDKQEAVVELQNAAEAGKLLLRTEPIVFNGNTLSLSEEGKDGAPTRIMAVPPKAGGLFVPRRAAISRPRAGLGHARASVSADAGPSNSKGSGKGQDDFRKMLMGK